MNARRGRTRGGSLCCPGVSEVSESAIPLRDARLRLIAALRDEAVTDIEVERLAIELQVFHGVHSQSVELLTSQLPTLPDSSVGWEVPLCGAAGKVRSVDRGLAEQLVEPGTPKSPGLLEADWIATRTALFYVTPGLGTAAWWPWSEIQSSAPGKRRWKFGGVLFRKQDGGEVDLRTTASDVDLLLALTKRFCSGPS
jgi:hypothetical protein